VEGRPLEESTLVERAQAGDAAAYEVLVARYQDLAFRVAYLILGGAAEAEDAAQEGFVKAYFALGRFRSGAPFRPWLLQIVANEARNRRKAAWRRGNLATRAAEERRSGDAAPSPETAALAQERASELLAAVNTLREEERLVVACRYFLSLSEAETAETLGLPKGTVKSRLSRALGRLRVSLGAPVPDDAPSADRERAAHG
jgi:RNA polymerase sigma-70 factor (ECF subfamily)